VNDSATPVAHEPVQFIDSHPLDVVGRSSTRFETRFSPLSGSRNDRSDSIPLPRQVSSPYFRGF
jgi:hypothetical protein